MYEPSTDPGAPSHPHTSSTPNNELSRFPFLAVDDAGFREIHGFRVKESNERTRRSRAAMFKGNYMAIYILRKLRTKKSKPCFSNLHVILNLPAELKLEIFGWLHPIDLYNLIRTTKFIRKLLINRGSIVVWKNAYLCYPDIPSCPVDVSHPKWTSLLFGPGGCDYCPEDAIVDFVFRERCCTDCMNIYYRSSKDFPDILESSLKIIFPRVRWTERWDGQYHAPVCDDFHLGRYHPKDIEKMAVEISSLLTAIEQKLPGSAERYNKFLQERADNAEILRKHANSCELWGQHVQQELEAEYNLLIANWMGRYEKWLLARGYDRKDVKEIPSTLKYILKEGEVKSLPLKRFRSYFREVESLASHAKCLRLAQERKILLANRIKEIDNLYLDVCRHEDATNRFHLPDKERLYHLDYFYRYIHDHSPQFDRIGYKAKFEIQNYIDEWIRGGQKAFHGLLTRNIRFMTEHNLENRSFDEVLNLATAIFCCMIHSDTNYCLLFGWKDVGPHMGCLYPCSSSSRPRFIHETYHFKADASLVALNLLKMLGLNPSATSTSHPRYQNARFVCTQCTLVVKGSVHGLPVMNFQECIHHAAGSHCSTHESFVLLSDEATRSVLYLEPIVLLSDEATRSVLNLEPPYPDPHIIIWTCNLCSMQSSQKELESHIRLLHQIPNPVRDVHFRETYTRRQLYFLGLAPRVDMRCMHCPSPQNVFLWSKLLLLLHLESLHNIVDARKDTDWVQIELLVQKSPEAQSPLPV